MKTTKQVWSEDQQFCINALAEWACGHHHLPKVHEFGVGICINYSGDLSTFDFDRLTRLVLIAHKHYIRIEIASSGPRLVRIIAHRRKRDGNIYNRHPGLDELENTIKQWK